MCVRGCVSKKILDPRSYTTTNTEHAVQALHPRHCRHKKKAKLTLDAQELGKRPRPRTWGGFVPAMLLHFDYTPFSALPPAPPTDRTGFAHLHGALNAAHFSQERQQQARLAAPGRAVDAHELPGLNLEGNVG